jgi:hypothetical protein
VLSHAHGIPSAAEALLFLVGAVAAYALVRGLAFGGFSEHVIPEPARAVVWGGLHFFSVGLAIAAAALVAELVSKPSAWPLGAFLAGGHRFTRSRPHTQPAPEARFPIEEER